MLDGWHLTYGNWVGTWWISRISRTHSLATLRNQFSCSPCSHFSDYFQTASAIANAESSAWHGSEILPDNWRHNEFQNPGIANSVVLGENSCNPSIQYPTEYNRLTRVCTLLRVTPQNTSTPKLSILTVSGDFCRHGVGDWLFVLFKKKLDFFQSSDYICSDRRGWCLASINRVSDKGLKLQLEEGITCSLTWLGQCAWTLQMWNTGIVSKNSWKKLLKHAIISSPMEPLVKKSAIVSYLSYSVNSSRNLNLKNISPSTYINCLPIFSTFIWCAIYLFCFYHV